jgi:hypothetical protein
LQALFPQSVEYSQLDSLLKELIELVLIITQSILYRFDRESYLNNPCVKQLPLLNPSYHHLALLLFDALFLRCASYVQPFI